MSPVKTHNPRPMARDRVPLPVKTRVQVPMIAAPTPAVFHGWSENHCVFDVGLMATPPSWRPEPHRARLVPPGPPGVSRLIPMKETRRQPPGTGRQIVIVVPTPTVESTETLPRCASVNSLTMARPIPVPGMRLFCPPTR